MLRAVFLSLALALSLVAEEYAFVKPSDFWRVQAFTPGAAEPKNSWAELEYDDSSWPLLQASFTSGIVGIPGQAERTAVSVVGGIVTYCFRKTFQINDPSFVQWLHLRIDFESGFVAHLNGVEIARRGFPGSDPVLLGNPAAVHPRGPTELIDVSAGIRHLRAGTNVLAIQVHSAGQSYPGLLLVTELLANFTRGPFVQNMTTNSTQVIWQTGRTTTGFVVYGKGPDDYSIAFSEQTTPLHVVTLTDLEPGEVYQYRVYAQDSSGVAASDWMSFRALKMPGSPISFLVLGDSGQGTPALYNIAAQMKAAGADLVVHVGDVIYPYFTMLKVDARCFSIYREQMRSTPFFFCLGNHDGYGPSLQRDWREAFYLPTNSVTGTEHYYSFDHGDAHFVVLSLDTQQFWAEPANFYSPGSPQYNWLETDLAASTKRWKFLFFHHTYRTSSLHYSDDFLLTGGLDKFEMQASIGVLAERHGAQIIFNGHDHDYERFAAINGVNSFVSGGGGATLYPQAYDEPGSVQFLASHNFLKVSIDGPELKLEAINDNGAIIDRFYRSQAAYGPQPFAAAWGTPQVGTSAGSHSDGNTPGQTFAFNGPSIRTRAGLRSNLGRIHVRNDRRNLYIGFEQASIWENQAIALFLENPAQPGVAELGPLGNGLIDFPENENIEGVDGLDLLQALVFKNFRPSIACLLGDEKADSNSRFFSRPAMRWPIGQGVFRLDSMFSTVPGSHLQQFNRSPQNVPTKFPESNADLIEIAIPLVEFGRPKAPATLRLGAIVFGDPGGDKLEPAIDTACAGQSLESLGEGRFLLEPMNIQLAPNPNPFQDEYEFTAILMAPNQIRFEWNSIAGATYRIQATTDLAQPFQDLEAPGLPITANGGQTTFDLVVDATTHRFYRLRVGQ